MTEIQFTLFDKRAIAPKYAHASDAGADLSCIEDIYLEPGQRMLVRTGIGIALPDGFVGLVHPRSGLAVKHGISLVNTPGTIDAGYRGEIQICLINLDGKESVHLPAGTRIAQLVIQEFVTASFKFVECLSESDRGMDGFGSTGLQGA